MITFGKRDNVQGTPVKLEGKIVGNIKPCLGGYAYFPKRKRNTHGEVYATFLECKYSVMGEEEE